MCAKGKAVSRNLLMSCPGLAFYCSTSVLTGRNHSSSRTENKQRSYHPNLTVSLKSTAAFCNMLLLSSEAVVQFQRLIFEEITAKGTSSLIQLSGAQTELSFWNCYPLKEDKSLANGITVNFHHQTDM